MELDRKGMIAAFFGGGANAEELIPQDLLLETLKWFPISPLNFEKGRPSYTNGYRENESWCFNRKLNGSERLSILVGVSGAFVAKRRAHPS